MSQPTLNRWENPHYIRELWNSRVIINKVAQLINCDVQTLEEAIRLRRTEWESIYLWDETWIDRLSTFSAGYNLFQIPKSDGSSRTISEPAPVLKRVQWEIKDILLWQIETYSGAIWGERWRSFIDNARKHTSNSRGYLVNMDLANAYPSVDARRIFVNLREALRTKISISLPTISQEEKEKIIDCIVILITHNGSLPQWASTSMKVLNIVMAKSDQRILQILEELWLHTPIYSRYVDDLSISWREFSDILPVWKLRWKILRSIENLENNTNTLDQEAIVNFISEWELVLWQLQESNFSLHTREQRRYLVWFIIKLHETLDSFTAYVVSNYPALAPKIDWLKRRVKDLRHEYEQNMKINNGVWLIRDEVRKVLIQEWWKIKDSKTRFWTPASSQQKIITWVSLSRTWELGIPKNKENEIRDFLDRAISHPDTLPKTCRGNPRKIAEIILGYKNYITQVRWGINSDLAKKFRACKALYYPNSSDISSNIWYNWFTYNGS